MKIIIISGKSGSGKDTFANLMREKLEAAGCNCVTIHYADLVKYYATQYYHWNGEKDEAGRQLLTTIGTDKVRSLLPDYWSEIVAKFLCVAAHYDDFDCAFIPDARFPNEIEVVMEYNPDVTTIRMNRINEDGSIYLNPALTAEQLNHASEISLDNYPFDYIVENHNLNELNDSADVILEDLDLLK